MVEFSFHSLELLVCLDSLSTPTFIDPDKYSESNRDRFKRYCQISLLIGVKSWFLVPPTFIKYDRTLMLSMRMWTVIASFSFNVKDIAVYLGALSFKTFMRDFRSSTDHGPLVVRPWQLAPRPCNDVSGLSINWGGGEIKNLLLQRVKSSFHHNNSFLASVEIVTFLSPRKSCDKLISESVYVEHDISGGVLEELLLLWMITFQSVCLVPWMLLSPCVGFPGIDSVLWVSP